jgi:disulfide bond formation protein DsbB
VLRELWGESLVPQRVWFEFFAVLTAFADLAIVGLLGLTAAAVVDERARDRLGDLRQALAASGLALAAVVTGAATLGSLYLSEVAHLVPCRLCWYQRIAMYSTAVILVAAAIRRDRNIRFYGILLVSLGTIVSAYHYLIQRFPSLERGTSCDPLNPCTTTLVWKLHYISIPFMAGSAFVLAGLLLTLTPPSGPRRRANAARVPAVDDEPVAALR